MRGQNSGKKWKKVISEIPKLKETLKEQVNSRDNVSREREVKNEDNFKKKTKKQDKKEKSRDKKGLRESGQPASGPCVTLAALHFHVNSQSTALSNSTMTHLTCHFTGCHTANNILYFFLSFPNILKIENTPHTMKWTRGWQPNSCTAGNQHRYLSTA